MKLSLSCRIAEKSDRKDQAAVTIEKFIPMVAGNGFKGISFRASAVSIESKKEKLQTIKYLLKKYDLVASMVMGNVDLAANNENASNCLRFIKPHLDLADALNCSIVRIMIKNKDDIKFAQKSADEANERNITLVQQTHWGTLCETIEQANSLVNEIKRENFGITFEPANLMSCGQKINVSAINSLYPNIINCYFQNIHLTSKGEHVFKTFCKGDVNLSYVPLSSQKSINFVKIINQLKKNKYKGWITVHQPLLKNQTVKDAILEARNVFVPIVN